MSPRRAWPRVADFSTHYPGPLASRELVHLGADVVKFEHPVLGDGNRRLGNPLGGATDVHHTINAGTRSIAADLRSPEWPEIVAAAARWADVVIVGARPEDAVRRGLDFATIRAANPDIVYCVVTGYGESGPWADRPAHGLQPDAMAGLVPVIDRDGVPTVPADYQAQGTGLAGVWAALGIQQALLRRSRGERAQYVSVSIWEASLAWNWRRTQAVANGLPEPAGFQALGPRYRMYACSDGRPLLVCPIEKKFWSRFVESLGLPEDWTERGDWSRGADRGEAFPDEAPAIAERLATRSAEEWEDELSAAGIPVAVVRDATAAVFSKQAEALGSFATVDADGERIRIPVPPVSVTSAGDPGDPAEAAHERSIRHRTRSEGLARAPRIGEHTEEIRAELGLPPSSANQSVRDADREGDK